jgi:hypothetical protein
MAFGALDAYATGGIAGLNSFGFVPAKWLQYGIVAARLTTFCAFAG